MPDYAERRIVHGERAANADAFAGALAAEVARSCALLMLGDGRGPLPDTQAACVWASIIR